MQVVKLVLLACFGSISLGAFTQAGAAQLADPREDLNALVTLIQERLSLMPDVARWKHVHSLGVRDPARERRVLDDVERQALEFGLDGALIRHFFRIQIDAASAKEEAELARLQPNQPIADLKDLTRELRPRLDWIGKQILVRLYLIASDQSRADSPATMRLASELQRAGLSAEQGRQAEHVVLTLRVLHAPSMDTIKRIGILRIATPADYAPFSVIEHGGLVGSDIEAIEKFAASMGLAPRFERTSWSALMSDYEHHAFDVAVGGISVTPERSVLAKFARAYHCGGKTPIVRCGSEQAFDTLEEIDSPQVKVIVNPGGTNEQFANSHFHRAHVIVFPDNTTIFQEIVAGRADVMVTDDAEVDLQVAKNPSLCRATPKTFTDAWKAWMLIDDPDLLSAANAWLTAHPSQ